MSANQEKTDNFVRISMLTADTPIVYADFVPYRVRDILEHWRCQRAITPAQFEAGRHFLRLYDSTIAGRAAIDPERIRVDGGLGHGPAAERMMLARSELDAIKTRGGRIRLRPTLPRARHGSGSQG